MKLIIGGCRKLVTKVLNEYSWLTGWSEPTKM